MLGYKYGVWLVYNHYMLNTEHISHFTVKCFMEKTDAIELCDKIVNIYGKTIEIDVQKEAIIYDNIFYKHDTNNIMAWGYNGKNKDWDKIKELCNYYAGDFSEIPHTSIYYNSKKEFLNPIDIPDILTITGEFKAVDINGEPTQWSIID